MSSSSSSPSTTWSRFRHGSKRFSLAPASHRAWTFAAITGTLGILLLLFWQWYGGPRAVGGVRQKFVEEGTTADADEKEPKTSVDPSVSVEPPIKPAAEYVRDEVQDFLIDTPKQPSTQIPRPDDFSAAEPTENIEPKWNDDAPPAETTVDIESREPELPETEIAANPVELPAEDAFGALPELPAFRSTATPQASEPAKDDGFENEFPSFPAAPKREELSFEDTPPEGDRGETLPERDPHSKVRDILGGVEMPRDEKAEPASEPEWNLHEEPAMTDGTVDEQEKPLNEEPAKKRSTDPFAPKPSEAEAPSLEQSDPPISIDPRPESLEPLPELDRQPAPIEPVEPLPTEPTRDEPSIPMEKEESHFPELPRSKSAPINDPEEFPSRTSITGSSLTDVVEPKISLTILSPAKVSLGKTCRVGFRVTNHGNQPVEEVRVLFDLPPELAYHKGRALVYSVGTLAAGETREARLTPHAVSPGQGLCRGVLQTSGERITNAESKVTVTQSTFDPNLQPVQHLQPAPQSPSISGPYRPFGPGYLPLHNHPPCTCEQ